jgi:hypothetical protein
MDEKQLQEWEALANAASPGPWEAARPEHAIPGPGCPMVVNGPQAEPGAYDDEMRPADAYFIAAARTAVPALVAEVRRLKRSECTAGLTEPQGPPTNLQPSSRRP